MQSNLVSICITTYNRKELLPLTLKSVLNQTYKNIEVIIVDDHSTDGTKELVENELLKCDDRVRYIRHEENKGLAAGRNTAIFNAKGKYFTFCDDDDEWMPEFIEKFINIVKNYDDRWCFCYNIEVAGSLKQVIYDGFTPPVASQFYYLSTLKKINGYNEKIKSGVDHDLWIRLSTINISLKSINLNMLKTSNIKHHQMTTNEMKRIKGIKQSLSIWKGDIQRVYSKDFYDFFYKNYMYYLDKNFLLLSLRNKALLKTLKYFLSINKYFLVLDIKRIIQKRVFRKTIRNTFFNYSKMANR